MYLQKKYLFGTVNNTGRWSVKHARLGNTFHCKFEPLYWFLVRFDGYQVQPGRWQIYLNLPVVKSWWNFPWRKCCFQILRFLSCREHLFACIILGKNLMTKNLSEDYLITSIITCSENSSIQTSFKQDIQTSKRAYCRDLFLPVNVFISNNHL